MKQSKSQPYPDFAARPRTHGALTRALAEARRRFKGESVARHCSAADFADEMAKFDLAHSRNLVESIVWTMDALEAAL